MATPKALIKYYDCLRDSFNKIQDRDNETALINAALRPKIREEFTKSQDLLVSYLDYIQVFSMIYEDMFPQICSTIIIPLFKEYSVNLQDIALKIHQTVETILESKKNLNLDFISGVLKVFPSLKNESDFIIYLKNSLYMFSYLDPETSTILMGKILEKMNPPAALMKEDQGDDSVLNDSYDVIYEFYDKLDEKLEAKFVHLLLSTFIKDHLTSDYPDRRLNYLILYCCSKNSEHVDHFLDSLWSVFNDSGKSLEERKASVHFASSLISRANYIDLEKLINHLQKTTKWLLDLNTTTTSANSTTSSHKKALFNALAQSIFYLISQRHRELYEEQTISRMRALGLDDILKSPFEPLQNCSPDICRRFQGVASLYQITDPDIIQLSDVKRLKRDRASGQFQMQWRPPYRETCDAVSSRIKNLYRNYYDHSHFTLIRD